MAEVPKEPKLPEWILWTSRGHQNPRTIWPAQPEFSDFHAKMSHPPTSYVTVSMCCWTDLLGFGQTLKDSQWQPSEAAWKALHERISEAHACCYNNLDPPKEIVLALNDGVVRCYDWGQFNHLDLLSMWLRSCVFTHNWINDRESYKGLPGARSVLSCGQQLRFSHSEFRLRDFIANYSKPPGGGTRMPEDLANRLVAINPTELQLNLGFSRAYLLDQAGTKEGIKGAHFYLDQTVIDFLAEEASRTGSTVVETTNEAGRLFAIRMENRKDYFVLGFLLEARPISVTTRLISTTVWRVLGYCPSDEPQPFGFAVV